MNISNCWYDRACSSEDVYDRFICVYIAFNYLYAGTRQKNESERICATRYAEALCDKYDFDPFSCDVSEYVRLFCGSGQKTSLKSCSENRLSIDFRL